MKISIKNLFVLLAIVMSLVAVPAVWADTATLTVTGTIERIGTASIDVVTSDGALYTFYDIPVDVQGILTPGKEVTVSAYVVTFLNETVKYIAYSITVSYDGSSTTYEWHPKVPKVGTSALSATATAATDCTYDNCHCNCPGDCIDCTCDCSCDCTCDGTGPKGPQGPKK